MQGKLRHWTNCKVLGESKLGTYRLHIQVSKRENLFTSAEMMIMQLVTNDDTMMYMLPDVNHGMAQAERVQVDAPVDNRCHNWW